MVTPVISADVPRYAIFTAAGGQTDFPITFAYLEQEGVRVEVVRNGALLSVFTGGDGQLACDPQTDAELVEGVAGTATIPARQVGDLVIVFAVTTPERDASYTQTGQFRATMVNREFNRRVAVEAELRETLQRAILSPRWLDAPALSVPASGREYIAIGPDGIHQTAGPIGVTPGAGWQANLESNFTVFDDGLMHRAGTETVTGPKRFAAKLKAGAANDSYATSAGAPGGETASFTLYTSQASFAAPELFNRQTLTIVDSGLGPGKQARGDMNVLVVTTTLPVEKIAVGSDYGEIRSTLTIAESVFVRTAQLLLFSGAEIAVGHGFFGGTRLEPGASGRYVLARGATLFTRNTSNFGVTGGFIDTAEAIYGENYVGPNAKTLVANGILSRIDNDGEVGSAFGYRAQYYNDGTITGDYFGFYAEELNGNSVLGQSWGFYAQTGANNYFKGDLRVGTTLAGDTKLNVNQGARVNVARFTRDDDGALGPQSVSMHNSASMAVNDVIQQHNYNANTSAGSEVTYARDETQVTNVTAGAIASRRAFRTTVAGALQRAGYFQAGLVVGSPTGGDIAVGVGNFEAVRDDNVLLTCAPVAQWLDGKIDVDFWDAAVANRVIEAEPDQKQVLIWPMDREIRDRVLIDGQMQDVVRTVTGEEVITETVIDRDEAGNPRLHMMPAREVLLVDQDGQLMLEDVERWTLPPLEDMAPLQQRQHVQLRRRLRDLEVFLGKIRSGKDDVPEEEIEATIAALEADIAALRQAMGATRHIVQEPRREFIPTHWKVKTREEPVYETIPGKPEEVIERRHEPLRKFMARLGTEFDPMTLAGQIAHVRAKRHLTPFQNPMKADPAKPLYVGEAVQRLMEWADLSFIYDAELLGHIEALRARVDALEAERAARA